MQGTPTSVAMTDGTDRVAPEHWQPRGVTPVEGARERQRGWQLLGQVLVKRGLLSPEQLAAAFERQRQGAQRLGRVLVELKIISETALLECLALQFDKPLMSEEELANLEPEVVRILPEETARLNMVVAVARSARQLVVAIADPLNVLALDEVRRVTGLDVDFRIAPAAAIQTTIQRHYKALESERDDETVRQDLGLTVVPAVRAEDAGDLKQLRTPADGPAVVRHYTLEGLGFDPDQLALFRDAIRRPWGMILMTGPTGSGKSTTLHTALKAIKSPRKNIVTVEDPVEYRQPGIQQVQVKSEIGFDFARSLRAILRQDPDVIMIGEIRDNETAQIAVRAALTGHLVFSTVHANDAVATIVRLVNIGVEPFLVASAVNLTAAQRLIRKICAHCKESYEPGPDDRVVLAEVGCPDVLYRGRGCKRCRNTGFAGRIALFEVLRITADVRGMILSGFSADRIQKLALESGMVPLRLAGLRKVAQGVTTLEEVLAVVADQE